MNIVKSGSDFKVFKDITILSDFPVGYYELDWNIFGDVYLKSSSELIIPPKLYDVGDEVMIKQVLKSFTEGNRNVGVSLTGYKGQGKTVTAKRIAITCNLPVIKITKLVPKRVDFISFLASIEQDICMYIDEFEKIFSSKMDKDSEYHDQTSFLQLMDGNMTNKYKKLFILTSNDGINEYLENRPSRVRYNKKYNYIDQRTFDMIVDDKLLYKEHEEDLRKNLSLIDCTIDMLITIIEEINNHNVPYSLFKPFFNHKPRKISYSRSIREADGSWKYIDSIKIDYLLDRSVQYINNERIFDIIEASDTEFTYIVKEDKYDNDDEFVGTTTKMYRLTQAIDTSLTL